MRIDLSVASEAVGAAQGDQAPIKKPAESETSQAVGLPQDTASLSSSRTSVSALTTQALATGEIRSAKVEALQQAVESGSYKVDASAVADAMIGEGA